MKKSTLKLIIKIIVCIILLKLNTFIWSIGINEVLCFFIGCASLLVMFLLLVGYTGDVKKTSKDVYIKK